MAKRILIVGGVAGGASAAARLRRLDETAEIIMFERGDYISFANCGLPYYIGGAIKNRDDLLLQTPESFKKRFNIDVRVRNEVTAIDSGKKQINVKNLISGETYTESYDKLILSPGAEPVKPPIPGIDSDRIFTLRNVSGTDLINDFIDEHKPRRAVIVGAGYIGLEMAKNLRRRGMLVAIVEMVDQVLPVMDKEMAGFVASNILEGTMEVVHWNQLDEADYILDVRSAGEFNRGNIPSSVNIPVDELRNRLNELPQDTTINVYCTVGIRSYIACRILIQNGFIARNISGGFITHRSYQNKEMLDHPTARQLKEEFCFI